MICLILVWMMVTLAETGILLLVNKRNPECRLNVRKYTIIFLVGNVAMMFLSRLKEIQGGNITYWYFGIFTYLFCLTVYDLRFKVLPDWFHLLPLAFYAMFWVLKKQPVVWQESAFIEIVLGAILGLVILLKRDAIGVGDVKLILVIALYAGLSCGGIIIRAMILAFICSIILILFKKVTTKSELPFVPFLFLGALLMK